MLKGLLLFNKCAYYFSSVKQYLYHTYEHIKQCLTNYDYSLWIFLPGHSLPLPSSFISNPVTYYWKYDTYTNQLIRHSTKPLQPYVLSVLSAKLLVTPTIPGETKEYDMDPFLETFRVHTDTHPPTLKMIVMAWCAQHKLWFPANCPIHMEYIDNLGNFVNINLVDESTITIEQNKLHINYSPSCQ